MVVVVWLCGGPSPIDSLLWLLVAPAPCPVGARPQPHLIPRPLLLWDELAHRRPWPRAVALRQCRLAAFRFSLGAQSLVSKQSVSHASGDLTASSSAEELRVISWQLSVIKCTLPALCDGYFFLWQKSQTRWRLTGLQQRTLRVRASVVIWEAAQRAGMWAWGVKEGGGAGGYQAAFCWVSCRLKYKNLCSCIKHCQFLDFIVTLHPHFAVSEGRKKLVG